MLDIYVARHGQNEDNVNHILNGHRDLPLTALGLKQAWELARGIKEKNLTFDAVYASPLQRALRTAQVVCEALRLRQQPQVLDSLIERNFGEMTGQSIDCIEEKCAPHILKTEIITYFLEPAGGETFPDTLERAREVIDHVRSCHEEGRILLTTHGDTGKMLYAAFYDLPWRDVLTNFHFGNCELLQLTDGGDPTMPHVVRIPQHNH